MALMGAGNFILIHFGGSLILSVDDKGLFLILVILRRLVPPSSSRHSFSSSSSVTDNDVDPLVVSILPVSLSSRRRECHVYSNPTYITSLDRSISNPAIRSFTLSVLVTNSVCLIIKFQIALAAGGRPLPW